MVQPSGGVAARADTNDTNTGPKKCCGIGFLLLALKECVLKAFILSVEFYPFSLSVTTYHQNMCVQISQNQSVDDDASFSGQIIFHLSPHGQSIDISDHFGFLHTLPDLVSVHIREDVKKFLRNPSIRKGGGGGVLLLQTSRRILQKSC